jgi:hypothetical protein
LKGPNAWPSTGQATCCIEEAIELYRKEGKPLPPATSGRDFANKTTSYKKPG